MALRKPTRTTDHVTVISWLDTSVNQDAEGFGDIVAKYMSSEVPDPSILPMREGAEAPTEFVLRPLGEREIGICDDLARTVEADQDGEIQVETSSSEQNWQYVRFGLVEAKNYGGEWTAKKARLYSFSVWDLDELEQLLDNYTVQLLGTVIRRWSIMQKKTSLRSGLLPDGTSGTEPIQEASVHSIATSADMTKDTEPCTDVTNQDQTLAR